LGDLAGLGGRCRGDALGSINSNKKDYSYYHNFVIIHSNVFSNIKKQTNLKV